MTASALYDGFVAHSRLGRVEHRLSYPIWMALIDLDELPEAFSHHPLWSARRPALVRFNADDLLQGGPSLPDQARELTRERLGLAPEGAVRVLSMPRFAGVRFNPVTFTYLHGPGGDLEALIAEVTNTPWGDRHRYVAAADGGAARARFEKRMHVSPFMPMDQTYELLATEPGDRLEVRISSTQAGRRVFEASLALRRREISRAEMTRLLLRYPPQPVAALVRIYAHALRLRRAGASVHPRPAPT